MDLPYRLKSASVALGQFQGGRLWAFIGIAVGGVAMHFLHVAVSNRDLARGIREGSDLIADPFTWLIVVLVITGAVFFATGRIERRMRREAVSYECQIRDEIRFVELARECDPAISAMARYVVIQKLRNRLDNRADDLEVWEEIKEELESEMANMDELRRWRLISQSDSIRQIRDIPRRIIRKEAESAKSYLQFRGAQQPRSDLRFKRLPSGRLYVHWHQRGCSPVTPEESRLVNPSWTPFQPDLADTVSDCGLMSDAIRIDSEHPNCTFATMILGRVGLPELGKQSVDEFSFREWRTLSDQEKAEIISIEFGEYESGLARLKSQWFSDKALTIDIGAAEVRSLLARGLYLQDREQEEPDEFPIHHWPGSWFEDTHARIDPDSHLSRLCVLDNLSIVDRGLLVELGYLQEVVVFSPPPYPVDGGPEPQPVFIPNTLYQLFVVR